MAFWARPEKDSVQSASPSHPRDLGVALGQHLEQTREAREAVRLHAENEANLRRAELAARVDGIQRRALLHESKAERLERRLSQLEERIADLSGLRLRSPSSMSLPRAGLYLFLAVLALLADLPIITEVLARVLDASGYLIDGKPLPTVMMNDFAKAWGENAELILLVGACVTMAMAVKVLLDVFSEEADEPGRRWERGVTGSVVAIAVIAAITLGAARLDPSVVFNPSENQDQLWVRIISMLLGIVLPFLSLLFFMRFTRVLGRRLTLWIASVHRFFSERRSDEARETVSELTEEKDRTTTELEDWSSDSANVRARVATALAQFDFGYAEGIRRALAPGRKGAIFASFERWALHQLFAGDLNISAFASENPDADGGADPS